MVQGVRYAGVEVHGGSVSIRTVTREPSKTSRHEENVRTQGADWHAIVELHDAVSGFETNTLFWCSNTHRASNQDRVDLDVLAQHPKGERGDRHPLSDHHTNEVRWCQRRMLLRLNAEAERTLNNCILNTSKREYCALVCADPYQARRSAPAQTP